MARGEDGRRRERGYRRELGIGSMSPAVGVEAAPFWSQGLLRWFYYAFMDAT